MKLLGFTILIIILGVAIAAVVNHNGQPGCKTEEELRVKVYRNNWDPTSHWVCSVINVPAVEQRCPPSLLFLDAEKKCINSFDWYWTAPQEPPSRP